MIWVRNFVTEYVWEENYSSTVLPMPRPPVAAVITDMLSLISFLKSSQTLLHSKSVVSWLKEFVRVTSLCSIRQDDVDKDWLVRGYLADMFCVVAGCPSLPSGGLPPSGYGWDKHRGNKETLIALDDETTPAQLLFFNLEPPISAAASDPSVSLEDLDASFILSGPFRFAVTHRIDRHLSLNSQNRILIYSGSIRTYKWDTIHNASSRFDLYDLHFLKESLTFQYLS
jgi:hypothetical protein